jgi:alkanesulfonate monooxygenase SsuD/methylene tetrahydromethanopterin reductase-like flavin-dependent oxidoreductase (luciferase family)
MHVGLSHSFQNIGAALSDEQVWANEVHMAQRAVEIGFDGIWATEHHFSDYEITPEPLQYLSFVAGRWPSVQLGTMVVVLPWHDPIRVAEQISVLDTLSEGRLTLGIGRGIGKIEFDGFRIPMEESRERFVEAAELILNALDTGVLRYEGEHFTVPERRLRPAPRGSFRDRTYAAAMSPESFEIMARLGVGMLIIASKAWTKVAEDMAGYRDLFRTLNGREAPSPLANAFMVCDKDPARAEDLAVRHMGAYWRSVVEHYEFTGTQFAETKGFEHYAKMSDEVRLEGVDTVTANFIGTQVFGTPEQCAEKIIWLTETVGAETFLPVFLYGGMPIDDAMRSMETFAAGVMPTLQAHTPGVAIG